VLDNTALDHVDVRVGHLVNHRPHATTARLEDKNLVITDNTLGYNRPLGSVKQADLVLRHDPSNRPDPTAIEWIPRARDALSCCANATAWRMLGVRLEEAMSMPTTWTIEVSFSEDDVRTDAQAVLRTPDGAELTANGHARRNPADPARPKIGEEIATARALSHLVHQLLDKAAGELEEVTHEPAHLHV
jgi:hypothetical protein